MKSKKRLDYTLAAEGIAEYAFIPTYLRLMAERYDIQAVQSKLDLKKKQPSKSKVLIEAGKLCIAAITEEHDLFIAGVDLDQADHGKEQVNHTAECKKLSDAMGKTYTAYKDIIILYVPVQAIEHWLVYQAHKIGVPITLAPHSAEGKKQDEFKKALYKGKEDQFTMTSIAEKIAERADFDELAKQSRSFAHFHRQVTKFLEDF